MKSKVIELRADAGIGWNAHKDYLSDMAEVEQDRDKMLRSLAKWTNKPLQEIVTYVGNMTQPGRTFDEHLCAIHGWVSFQVFA